MQGATPVSPITSPSMPPVAASISLLTGERLPLRLASLSPLRYPGSKRKMLPAIRQLIDGNIPHPELFVEPFCGGASVSLGLLELDAVQRVLLADLDPLVAAFWQEATRDADGLIKEIRSLDVTVEQWDYWRRARPRSIRQLAVKCLFLNRTTFSGILGGHAGPIGGRTQSSGYTIDCRFNKDALAERILNVKRLHDEGRIAGVLSSGWQQTMHRANGYAALNDNPAATLPFYPQPAVHQQGRPDLRAPVHRPRPSRTRRLPQGQHAPLDPVVRRGTAHPRPVPRSVRCALRYRVTHHYTMTGKRKKAVPGRKVIFTNLPIDPTAGTDCSR